METKAVDSSQPTKLQTVIKSPSDIINLEAIKGKIDLEKIITSQKINANPYGQIQL